MTELLYQTDSYLQEFDATVTGTVTGVDQEAHAILLDRSAFYPGGGGQPADSGLLIVGSQQYPIARAKKTGDDVYHFLAGDAPLPQVGAPAHGQIDWERRYQLMRTHTAMHVLCGVVFRDYGAQVTGGDMDPLQRAHGFRVRDHAEGAGAGDRSRRQPGGGQPPTRCGWRSCRASKPSRSPT